MEWCSLFPEAKVRHLIAPVSDYSSIFLSLDSSVCAKRILFRFEDMWTEIIFLLILCLRNGS